MPVILQACCALLLVSGLVWTHSALAQQKPREFIRHASQLMGDKKLQAYSYSYTTLAAANAVYTRCEKQLRITPEQKQFVADKLTLVSKGYMEAFDQVFVAEVGAPSSPDMVKEYADYMTAQQNQSMQRMDLSIRQEGCGNYQLKPIFEYIETLRQQDAQAAAAAAAATPAPATTTH